MSTIAWDRRDFLKVTVAGTSGLVLGLHLSSSIAEAAPAENFEPNVWISIDPTGAVTITVAKQEMGQGVLTSLSMIVAEELDADWSMVRAVQADAHPTKYGSQGTGGSSSVRTSYERLRQAGATAKMMLVSAAADRWNVPPSSCLARESVVTHPPTNRHATYGELAEAAARQPVPEMATLKDPKDFRIIGTRTKRLDTAAKVNGGYQFGLDVRVPGMLFCVIARSPSFGGKVRTFDATKTRTVSGVVDVVQTDDGIAVLGKHTWAVIRGRETLTVEWDPGSNADFSSEKMWKQFEEASAQAGTVDRTVGNPDSALRTAARVLEATYQVPILAHATMEPMNCTADVRPDRCEIWAPTQAPQRVQNEAARVLGLKADMVAVHVTGMGGGFGRRLQADYAVEAVRVSKAVGSPVQVVWTREDDMTHDFYRPSSMSVLRAGLDASGSPVAWTHRMAGANVRGLVVPSSWPEYDIPNVAVDFHILTTPVPIGAWRSVGAGHNVWLVESFMDELAHAAGQDPVAYRLAHLKKHPRQHRCVEEAAKRSGWGTPLPHGRGRGIAVGEDFGTVVAEVAEVSIEQGRIKVHRIVAVVDCGPYVNPDTIEAQVEGAIVYGLSAALYGEITLKDGRVEQQNFDSYPVMRLDDMPVVEVHLLKSDAPMGGIGEPGLPPATPAVCNALFALTGRRVRKLPVVL